MKYTALVKFIFCLWIFVFLLVFSQDSYAQTSSSQISSGVAVSVTVVDKNAKDGNIIVSTKKGYDLSKTAYDPNIYGVLTENPAIYLQNAESSGPKPVLTWGKAYVLVSTINGNIQKNDVITTSTIHGVGQRADKNGNVLGTALEGYSNSKAVEKILVAVNPNYNTSFVNVRANLLDTLKTALSPSPLSQLTSLRYVLASVIVVLSFIIGIIYFGRIARSGIEAIGRNPLASRTIQFSIGINLILMVVIIIAGLGIGYMILIL